MRLSNKERVRLHKSMPVGNPRNDLTGRRFGRLIVSGDPRSHSSGAKKRIMWLCQCDCGGLTVGVTDKLKSGEKSSCGCLEIENRIIHGLSSIERYTYRSWNSMIARCDHPSTNGYENYGGKGITYCDRWKNFAYFFEDMGRRPQGYSLDRYRPDHDPSSGLLNYCKENCRWASKMQQAENRKGVVLLTNNGKTQSINAWSKDTGVARETIKKRYLKGMSDSDCLAGRVQ